MPVYPVKGYSITVPITDPKFAPAMGYKHRTLDVDTVRTALLAPNYLLKIIPHVDGSPRICRIHQR